MGGSRSHIAPERRPTRGGQEAQSEQLGPISNAEAQRQLDMGVDAHRRDPRGVSAGVEALEEALLALEGILADANRLQALGVTPEDAGRLQAVLERGRALAAGRRVTLVDPASPIPYAVAERFSEGAEACYDLRADWVWLDRHLGADGATDPWTQAKILHEVAHAQQLSEAGLAELVLQNAAEVDSIDPMDADAHDIDTLLRGHVLTMRMEYQAHRTEHLGLHLLQDARDRAAGEDNGAVHGRRLAVLDGTARRGASYRHARAGFRACLYSPRVDESSYRRAEYERAVDTYVTRGGRVPSLSDFRN